MIIKKIRKAIWKRIRKPIVKFYRFYTLKVMYPSIYRKYSRKPVNENKVVFIEVRMPKISDSFELLYNDLNDNYNYEIHTHFLRMSFVRKLEYMKLCRAMVKDIADAKYIFLNESSDVTSCLPMRKETVLTQLWHACGAFKKFGMSTADLIFGDDRKTLMKYPYHKNYTYVTVSSPEIVWAYEEAMSVKPGSGVVTPVGISRTDVFFDDKFIDKAKTTLYEKCPYAKGKKVILYAPTFRGRVASAKTPNVLDIPMLYKKLGKDYVVITKHHPFVKKRPVIPEKYQKFMFDMTDDITIEDLLCVSDVCISDYSSLVFEYSLFTKPMIFLAYDLDNYFDWRGFYYDYKDFVPGPIFDSTVQIVDYIEHIDERFDKQKVIDFRNKFMSSCDGHVTERIEKLVFGEAMDKHRR